MSKHTPGPWQVMNDYDGATIVVANVDGETFSDGTSTFSYDFVCDTYGDGDDDSRSKAVAIANARLIAAAPDMLAALKAMDAALCDGFGTQAARMAGRKALIAVRAAIAKAEGQQ
jgi:hypothetical protein